MYGSGRRGRNLPRSSHKKVYSFTVSRSVTGMTHAEHKKGLTMRTPEVRSDSLGDGPADSSKALSGRPSKRGRRLREYRCQALDHHDALHANLGVMNADLMEIANGLGKVIRSALRGQANPLETYPDLPKVLQTYHNCARLVQRFTLFDERFRSPPTTTDSVSTAATVEEPPEASAETSRRRK